MPAPFVPSVASELCTANFDAQWTSAPALDSPGGTPDLSSLANPFLGCAPPEEQARLLTAESPLFADTYTRSPVSGFAAMRLRVAERHQAQTAPAPDLGVANEKLDGCALDAGLPVLDGADCTLTAGRLTDS
jgi:hypothetical protein